MGQYARVAPRDLFSEANFLKCIAQIVHSIEEGKLRNISYDKSFTPAFLPFDKDQTSDEHILQHNMFYRTSDMQEINLVRPCYSKEPWPIYWRTDEWDEYYLFNKDGSISDEFKEQLEHGDQIDSVTGHPDMMFATSLMLKCLGKLALDTIPNVNLGLPNITFDEDSYAIENYSFYKADGFLVPEQRYFKAFNEELLLGIDLTSKSLWPLQIMRGNSNITIFDERGNFSTEFLNFIDYQPL